MSTKSFDSNNEGNNPEIILHGRFLKWHIKFEKRKSFKKKIREE